MGVVYITPKGNMFVANEGLKGEAFDKVVAELFGTDELNGTKADRESKGIYEIEE